MPHADLIILRHGQSVWNAENRFTGWEDVGLSDKGVEEAKRAAQVLTQSGIRFDVAFTSYLRRAIKTLWTVLDVMDCLYLPQYTDWRLNERHYGALQGKNKSDAAAEYGDEQVRQWRRSYATPPPPLQVAAAAQTPPDGRYDGVAMPVGESLQDIMPRVEAVFAARIAPLLAERQCVLVVAHGNSLRALMKHLESIDDEAIMQVEIPTAAPIHYQLDAALRPIKKTEMMKP